MYFNSDVFTYLKGKAIPLQAWAGPVGSRSLRLPNFKDNQHMKVVRLSALRTNRLYCQELFLRLISESTPGPQFGQNDYVNEKFQ